ncbi:MAG TPA: ubiquitin-like protein UBact [Nitrospirales bacterium]|nr:ubiquitin-like protein UBact [Nitrospirales bacterium]HIB54989.1 ubiquitin-like protein UBact [Nitrospirales bacterium]HIC05111.1 ubiquitin-like protein UBact [Nitrospirales bacterium]HIO20897.1 ubiquitin-like protein UBact [Nitrospirales bacterium]HIO69469.1 ubiquitin-like protein UBact [Nitrospirales bacterium]
MKNRNEPHHFAQWERRERPIDPGPRPPAPKEDSGGPRRPDSGSPEKDELLKRMRKVDPKQAERYRQRTGE